MGDQIHANLKTECLSLGGLAKVGCYMLYIRTYVCTSIVHRKETNLWHQPTDWLTDWLTRNFTTWLRQVDATISLVQVLQLNGAYPASQAQDKSSSDRIYAT